MVGAKYLGVMGRTSLRPLVDRVLGGRLDELLIRWRDEGLTHDQIADRLHADHAIRVTGETVRQWCRTITSPETAS